MNSLPLKTILASAFLHLFVLQFCIFTISEKSISVKPLFVFLGSILQVEDLKKDHSKSKKSSIDFNETPLNINGDKGLNYTETVKKEIQASSKPSFSKAVRSLQKILFKTTFYQNNDKYYNREDREERVLGIDLNPPPRIPLRLLH